MTNENQIMMDGYPLQVGDRVYSILYGFGLITNIYNPNYSVYPIGVEFDDKKALFHTEDLRAHGEHIIRSLYWDIPEDTIPPPKPKVKKKIVVADWIVLYTMNMTAYVQGKSAEQMHIDFLNFANVILVQKIDGTERDIGVGK